MPYKDPVQALAYRKAHYLKNIERYKKQNAEWAATHKEEKRAADKSYQIANAEAIGKKRKAYREAHKEERALYDAKRRIEKKEQIQETQRRYYQNNRTRILAKVAALYQLNPQDFIEKALLYNATHPAKRAEIARRRRARQLGAPINDLTIEQVQEIKAHYRYRCVYCHKKFPAEKLEMDHITSLAHGGSHTAQNIAPACRTCNATKGMGAPKTPIQPLLLTVEPARKQPLS